MGRRTRRDYRTVFVCGVDWQHEIGDAACSHVYGSVEDLKAANPCWKECGIVKLKISLEKWVKPQKPIAEWKTVSLDSGILVSPHLAGKTKTPSDTDRGEKL